MSLDNNPLYELIRAQEQDLQGQAEKEGAEQRTLIEAEQDTTGRTEYQQSGLFASDAAGYAREIRVDNAYDETIDADFNLGALDMPTGINVAAPFGGDVSLDNRKYSIDRMRSITGLARTMNMVQDPAVLEDFYVKSREEFSDSGWVQMGRGLAGVLDPFHDVTGDAKAELDELREFMQTQQLTDKDGDVIPYTNKDFLDSVRRANPEASIMLDRYGITEENLEGVSNFGHAVEALSMQLFERGNMERSMTARERLSGGEKVMAFAENLGNMIGQDPDMAAEIGIEVGGLIASGLVSGGAAVPAYLAWRMAARGGKVFKAGTKVVDAQRKLDRMQRLALKTEKYSDVFSTAMNFKPSLSFGGNVAEYAARKYGLGPLQQNLAYFGGQVADGFVGGAGARLSSNMVLQEEAMLLYGDQQGINLTNNMWIEGAMGSGFSVILGSAFKFVPRGISKAMGNNTKLLYQDFSADKQVKVKNEEELLQKLYADPDTRPAGVSAFQAQRQMQQQALLDLSLVTGRKLDRGEGFKITDMLGSIPTDVGVAAIGRATRGMDEGSMTLADVRARILQDDDFLEAVATANEGLDLATINHRSQLEIAKLRKVAADEGRDLDYEAALLEGLSEADALAKAKETKIARARAAAEAADAEAKAARENLDTDAAAGERQGKRSEKMKRRADKKAKEEEAAQSKLREEIEDAEGDVETNKTARESQAKAKEADARADEAKKKADKALDDAKKADAAAKAKADKAATEARAKAEAEAKAAEEARIRAEEDAKKVEESRKDLTEEEQASVAAKKEQLAQMEADAEARQRQSAEAIQQADVAAQRKSRARLEAEAEQKARRAERRAKEAEEFEAKVREADDAGPVDVGEFSDIRSRKATQADTAFRELESDVSVLKGDDGKVRSEEFKRRIEGVKWDSDPTLLDDIAADLPDGLVDPEPYMARIKNRLEEAVDDVTDADIRLDTRLRNSEDAALVEVQLEGRNADVRAKHKVFMSKADGQIIDDPSKFRAPRVRADGEAKQATAAARAKAASDSAESSSLQTKLTKAEEELNLLRASEARQDIKPELLVEAESDAKVLALKQQRADELVATKSKDELYTAAKTLKKVLAKTGQKPDSAISGMDKAGLANFIAEFEIELARARQKQAGDAPSKNAKRIAELESEARALRSELHERGIYSREADIRAAREAEARLKKLMDRGSHGESEGALSSETGTISHDALHSIFEDSLEDIDLEFAFGEAIVSGTDTSNLKFNMQQVLTLLQARIDAIDGVRLDPDAALTPQQVRLRQANELKAWRAKKAAREALAYEEANGTTFRGTSENGQRIKTADEYEARVIGLLAELLDKRKLKRFRGKEGKEALKNPKLLHDLVKEELVGRFDGDEARLAHLGDGTLDHVHPTVAARAIADILSGTPDGTKQNKAEVTIPNEETGMDEVRTSQTRNVNTVSAAQPAHDREIADVLARMEYDYRIEAIAKHDFDNPTSVGLEDVLDFIDGANLVQDRGRVLNAEELELRARWVPPQLRTDIDAKPESIREKIARVKKEMLDMEAAAYDLIHDDFGTRRGDWGISKADANNRWGKTHSLAGGFPVASAMPNPDGGYSFGMAVLDTHAVNNPGTLAHTVAALKRGQDNFDRMRELETKQSAGEALSKSELDEMSALEADAAMRNVDGSQNGVRHAHAIAMMSRSQADTDAMHAAVIEALNTMDPAERAKLLRDHPEFGTAEKGKDFYVALADITNASMKKQGNNGNAMAKWVSENLQFERKDAKKPVMILPYGAGMKAIKNAAKSVLEDKSIKTESLPDGMTKDQLAQFIAEQWYGSQQKNIDSLINVALELPNSDVMMASLMRDRAGADPFAEMARKLGNKDWDSLSEDAKVELLLDEAEDRARAALGTTGELPDEAVNVQFYSLQIEARARAMTRAGDMSPEDALKVAREEWAEEITLVQTGTKEEIIDAVKSGNLSFFERTIRTLNRVEYYRATDAQAEATARQTGQGGVDFGRTMPEEAQGVFYAEQLMDWRTRMVTPNMAEADLKARKSRRGMLDIHGVMEEGETVVFKTSEAEAKADFDERVHKGKMTEDEWFAKHIDEEKTIGSGVVTFKEHRGTLRQRLENRANALKETELRNEEARLGLKIDDDASIDARRAALLDAYVKNEEARIEKLAVKSALAELAPDFSPPLARNAEGNTSQLPRLNEEQKMDRWQAQTDDVHSSAGEAARIYDGLDEDGKAAYRKNYGELYEPHRGADGADKLEETVSKANDRHAALKEGEHEPQVAKTMGGMLGSRAIHPTEALDVMLGVPALKEAAQRRTMGQQGGSQRVKQTAERQTRQVDALDRISEGGPLFSRNERHRVTHADRDMLASVKLDETDIFDAEIQARYGDDAANDMITRSLTRYAEENGLDELVDAGKWGDIVAHRMWTRNLKEIGNDYRALSKMRQGESESFAEYNARYEKAEADMLAKWRERAAEDRQTWETATNEEWKSHEIDPFGNINSVTAFDADGKALTRREALIRSAQMDRDGNPISSDAGKARQRAGLKTNIDLIDGESIDGMRYADGTVMPDPVRNRRVGRADLLPFEEPGADVPTRTQGFSRSAVDMDDLSDNVILQVHYVHAKDRASATGSVGAHMGESRLAGLHRMGEPMTARQARQLIAEGKIDGADANVRFFTADGIEVVSGQLVGHNLRRSATRNEAHHILMNSSNRYLGDRLAKSGLAKVAVRKQKSSAARMDDRLTRNRHETTQMVNEQKMIINYLRKNDPDSVQTSSFLGAILDIGESWNDPVRRRAILTSPVRREEAKARKLGVELSEIDNPLHGAERTFLRDIVLDVSRGTDPELRGELTLTKGEIMDRLNDGFKTKPKSLLEWANSLGDEVTLKQVMEEGARLKKLDDAYAPEVRYDPNSDPDLTIDTNVSKITDSELELAEELAGLHMILGGDAIDAISTSGIRTLMGSDLESRLGNVGSNIDRMRVLANKVVEHNRALRKLAEIAYTDGITGLGMTPTALRMIGDGTLVIDSIDDITSLSDVQLAEIRDQWLLTEHGGDKRSDLFGKELTDSDRKQVVAALAEAHRLSKDSPVDPFSDRVGPDLYSGPFVDAGGTPRDAMFFMESKNFAALSDGHRAFDEFLEDLMDSGTLGLPEVRMLRATLAQMEGDLLSGINFREVANLDDFAKEIGLSPSASRARGMSFSTKGHIGLALYKNRIGRDLNAVDVVLHEVGHISQSRLLAEGSPELTAVRSMAESKEGRDVMRDLVTQMHGGKFTQEAQKQLKYFISDPDEFIAAWFSYSLMTKTLKDRVTVEAAYRRSGGIGAALRNAMRKMAGFAYKRLAQFARAFQTADKAYMQQMDSVMQVMLGKADMPVVDRPIDFAKYHADGVDKVDALQAAREEVATLELMGIDETAPDMIQARETLRDIEDEVLRTARASEFDGSTRAATLEELLDSKVMDEFTEVDGTINFGRMVDENPDVATHWIVNNLLPQLQEGRYSGVDTIAMDVAKRRMLTKEGKVSLGARADNIILAAARAKDVVNSQVQMRVGDKTYSIMQLLAEMMDSGQVMTQGRLNGRDFMTLNGVAKSLESTVIRPIAILDDTLRIAVAKEQGSFGARVSRSLAQSNDKVAQRQQELRRMAGALLLPGDTAAYKKAKAELAELAPELKTVVSEMSDSFKSSSEQIKRQAVYGKLVGQKRSDDSGLMPIRIRPEFMTDKASTFGPALTDTYGSRMIEMSRNAGIYDVDSLIAAGVLPRPDRMRTADELARALTDAARDGLVSPKEVKRLRDTGELDRLFDQMKSGKEGTVNGKALLAPEGIKRYEGSVLNGEHAPEGEVYIKRRFQHELNKSRSAANKAFFQDANTSGANLRALRLGRRAGSTSYFFGGDEFLNISQLVNNHADFFDFDVRVGASALVRGIGLEAADASNLSKAFGHNVSGLSYKKLLDWLEKDMARNSDAQTIESLGNGMAHLRRAYEKLGGGLPTVDRTGNVVLDGVARNATDLAMLSYGGNLGVAMFAETAATLVGEALPRAISAPVKTTGMAWKALTGAMSPVRKNQLARQILFGMQLAKDTVNMREVGARDGVDDLNPMDKRNSFEKLLRAGASASSKLSMAPTVQSFNKGFAVAGAMDDLLANIEPARKLRQLLDDQSGVADVKEFKELAKQAGFGRRWELALRMQDAGLLDGTMLDSFAKEMSAQNAFETRFFDMDQMQVSFDNQRVRSFGTDMDGSDKLMAGLRSFMEEAVARHNVEPRVFDMKLVDNSGWNKIMDVFMTWPRAFYSQKSGVRNLGGGSRHLGGSMSHILGFYAAQTMWDALYTSMQGYARGEDPDQMLHEVESDPVGWYMQKASRMPLFGGWSMGAEMLVANARNMSAKSGLKDFTGVGYHTRPKGMDFGSSPVTGAVNSLYTFAESLAGYGAALTNGTVSLSTEDRKLQAILRSGAKLTPGANNLLSKVATEMWAPSNQKNALRNQTYYELKQLKADLKVDMDRMRARIR